MNGTNAPGTDVIDASTYKHMKIIYFNPNQTTISFADTATFGASTFKYYPGTNPSNTFSSADCATMTPDNTNNANIPNSLVFVRDARNNQVYKVKKMVDNKCWMIDNLKYSGNTDANGNLIQNYDGVDGGGNPNGTAGSTGIAFRNGTGPNIPTSTIGTFNTINGRDIQSATNDNKAFWNNPMSHAVCYNGLYSGNPTMATNTLTHCGYFYNFFAATGGTGNFGLSTNGAQATGSICPTNFRLPSSSSGTGGPTTAGTVYTHADFPVLNASMNAGSLATGVTTSSFFANWMPTGPWSGTLSGGWDAVLRFTGMDGYFWSSTNTSAVSASLLDFFDSTVSPDALNDKPLGNAIRCVLP